jgi:hypothetical protein
VSAPRRTVAEGDVRYLLSRFGPHEAEGIYNLLDRKYSRSEIRSALRALGAEARKYRDWPRYDTAGEAVSRKAGGAGTYIRVGDEKRDRCKSADDGPAFTVYSLTPARIERMSRFDFEQRGAE